ncbi:hypothetical protein BDV96DRAFT_64077 [Lophiotrema nucula]|uniref:YggU-like protein n=1 Tax=Lophiotrema nucula TaxID=690887 RepID=A0A6A5Z7Q9_9PLEO|nr:hypothetical protein BDV96DRAFT_64077 [Lophiotrema nucula]
MVSAHSGAYLRVTNPRHLPPFRCVSKHFGPADLPHSSRGLIDEKYVARNCSLAIQQSKLMATAVRFVKGKGTKGGLIQLLCHVKPGVSADREGISAVTDHQIDVCVAAPARDGEANMAVRVVIAKALKVPKTNIEIAKGTKGREKTVNLYEICPKDSTPDEEVERIKIILSESVTS